MKFTLLGMLASTGVFFLAVWPRYFNRYFGVDVWRILLIADYLRKNKGYPAYLSDRYIVQGKFDHPITLSAILSLFPKKWLDQYQWLFSPAIEALHCFTLFLYVHWLTGNITTAFMAQLFYILTPMVLIESSQLSSRSFGSFFFTLTWLPIMYFSLYGGWFSLVLALCMVVGLTFTHRMSIQVLVLLSVLMLIVTMTPWYLLLSAAGMATSWLCFGDKYKRILQAHLTMLRLWTVHIDKRYAHQIRGIPQGKQNNNQTDFVRRIEQIFLKLPGISLLAPNVWMTFVLLAPFLPGYAKLSGGTLFHIYLWAILLFALALATSVVKPLRFMGSGERYIEYSAFPVAIIASTLLTHTLEHPPIGMSTNLILGLVGTIALFGALLPSILMQVKVVMRDSGRSITPELWNIINYLKEEESKRTIRLACIPHQLADGILYFTNKVKLYLNDSNEHSDEMYEKWWPVIKQPLSETLNDRQITHLLVSLHYVALEELQISSYEVLREEGPYILLSLKGRQQL